MANEQKAMADVMVALNEGDIFEYGKPFSMIEESITWVCLENIVMNDEKGNPYHRVTLHTYLFDVFLRAQIVHVANGEMEWQS